MTTYMTERRAWLRELTRKTPCSICKRTFEGRATAVIFRNRDDKHTLLSQNLGASWEALKAELEKGEWIPTCKACSRQHFGIHRGPRYSDEREL
jgi:hypothetical protein